MARDLILRRQTSRFIPEWERDLFWSVFHDEVPVGVIVRAQGNSNPDSLWQWTVHLHAGRFANGVASLTGGAPDRDSAMTAFRQAFERAMDQIGDEGWALHLEHMAWLDAQAARWARQRAGTEPGGYG